MDLVIRILNAGLLLFAGFLAGNYFAPSHSPAPAHSRHAAEPAASPAETANFTASAPGRGPASVATSPSVSALGGGNGEAAPVDLAAYLLKFGIADVHEACEFAHNRFSDETVGAHARFVEGLDNFKEHKSYLSSLGKRLAEDEKFWVGRGDIEIDGGKARVEVVMDSHGFLPEAEEEDNASCFRAHVRVNLANGQNFSTVLDACTDALVTKNRAYYLNWEAYGDLAIGRKLAVMQIPLPGSSEPTELEFLRTNNEAWALSQGFAWTAVPLEAGLQLIDQQSPAVAQNRASFSP